MRKVHDMNSYIVQYRTPGDVKNRSVRVKANSMLDALARISESNVIGISRCADVGKMHAAALTGLRGQQGRMGK